MAPVILPYKRTWALPAAALPLLVSLKQAAAKRRLDASGLVVSPGFIDMHTHSDVVLLADGRGESMLRRG